VVCVYVGTYMCVCEDDILLQILGDEQQIREDIQIQLFHTRRPQQFRVTWLNLRQCSSLNDVAITSHQWHRLQQMHIPSTTNWLSQGLMSLSTQNRVILETSFKPITWSVDTERTRIVLNGGSSFVRYCGQGSSLLWTAALRPLCRSNAPAQGEERNW